MQKSKISSVPMIATANNGGNSLGDADGNLVPGGLVGRRGQKEIQAISMRVSSGRQLGVCLRIRMTCIEFAVTFRLGRANSSRIS